MRILHTLNWPLHDVISEIDDIANQGFDAIQINPIQPLKQDGYDFWWLSYQPCGFQIGNQYGSKEELIDLCYEANYHGIKIIADVVCNHMAGKNDGSLYPNEKVDPMLKNNPYVWKEFKNISNWEDRNQTINYCIGLPGLQPQNYDVQNKIIDFLNELIKCGVGGFRFDAAKNIALPKEGCDFWIRVLDNLDHHDLFNYGEIIFASESLLYEYSKYMNVITNSPFSSKEHLIAFVENHDSYLHFGYTKSLSTNQINNYYQGLVNEFPNTIYYARPYCDAWKSDIIKISNDSQKILTRIH